MDAPRVIQALRDAQGERRLSDNLLFQALATIPGESLREERRG